MATASASARLSQQVAERQKAVVNHESGNDETARRHPEYPRVEAEVRQSQTEENPAAVQEKVYDALSKEIGVDAKVLREKLPT